MPVMLFAKCFDGGAAECFLGRLAVAGEAGVLDEPNEDEAAVFFDVAVGGIGAAVADLISAGLKQKQRA